MGNSTRLVLMNKCRACKAGEDYIIQMIPVDMHMSNKLSAYHYFRALKTHQAQHDT